QVDAGAGIGCLAVGAADDQPVAAAVVAGEVAVGAGAARVVDLAAQPVRHAALHSLHDPERGRPATRAKVELDRLGGDIGVGRVLPEALLFNVRQDLVEDPPILFGGDERHTVRPLAARLPPAPARIRQVAVDVVVHVAGDTDLLEIVGTRYPV